jgi:hypothetical protein
MHATRILQLLALLAAANGAPVILNALLHTRCSYPLDGGATLPDRQPLFGASKTIRGILVSVIATAACAPLVRLSWKLGLAVGVVAMAGDLFSSFLKRRMQLPAGGRATGLDPIPEALFPALALRHALALSLLDVVVVVAVFFLGEVVLSILFYKLHLRERPY